MRIRRIIAALLRKVAAPSFLHEAATWRESAEAMRTGTALKQRPARPSRLRLASLGAGVCWSHRHIRSAKPRRGSMTDGDGSPT
jgi:hypothetical protein